MADQGNPILSVDLSANTFDYKTRSLYQYDHGMKLCLKGVSLSSIQVHFSNEHIKDAINLVYEQDENGDLIGDIPDIQLTKDESIVVYVYYEDATSGYTVKRILIPVVPRTKPEHITLNSPSLGPINELASQLQDLIDQVEDLKNSSGGDGGSSGGTGTDGKDGKDGVSPTVSVTDISGGHLISITDVNGTHDFEVLDGAAGKNGSDGADGISCTHSWNGTVLTVSSASGTSSADLKGEAGSSGSDGFSPTIYISRPL